MLTLLNKGARPIFLLAVITLLFSAGLSMSGIYAASLGQQVHYLWDNGIALTAWYADRPDGVIDTQGGLLVVTEAHRLRYALTYPLFLVAQTAGVSADGVYTSMVPILAALTVCAAGGVTRSVSGHPVTASATLCILPIALLFVTMDGRLVWAVTGYTIALWGVLSLSSAHLALKLLALVVGTFLTSVTSGTFVSTFAMIVFMSGYQAWHTHGRRQRALALLPVVYIALIFNYDLLVGIRKNLSFYGGGVEAVLVMLNHGVGRFLLTATSNPTNALVAAGVGLIGIATALWGLLRLSDIRLPLAVLMALALGLYGTSTLVLVVIPTVIWAATGLNIRQHSTTHV